MHLKKEDYYAVIYIIILFVWYMLWTCIQPLNASPDEEMRYLIPQYIFHHNCLPIGNDPEILNPLWGSSYGYTPILSYIFSAGFMKIAGIFSTDSVVLLIAARMTSVLSGIGTAVFAILIARRVFVRKAARTLFVFFITLMPQAVFVTSYVNNDAFAIFTTAWIVYIWIRSFDKGWSYPLCIQFGIAMGLAMMSYYNAYGYLLCSFFLFVITQLWFFHTDLSMKEKVCDLLKKGMLILLCVCAVAGWWYIRNYFIYDGDVIGMKTSNHYAELYAMDELKPSFINTPFEKGQSLFHMLFQQRWLAKTYISYIGYFGFMDIPLRIWMYLVYTILFLVGGIGAVVEFIREKSSARERMLSVFMILAMLLPIGISMYYSYYSDFQPQGRYILPMLVPCMYMMTRGIVYAVQKTAAYHSRKKTQNVNHEKTERLVSGVLYAAGIAVAAISLFSYILVFAPHYIK